MTTKTKFQYLLPYLFFLFAFLDPPLSNLCWWPRSIENPQMQAPGSNITICPTFNPRSNVHLSEIGAKIAQDHAFLPPPPPAADSDFAFATRSSTPSSPIPADEIFQNGTIRPLYLIPTLNPNYTAHNAVLNRDSPPLPIPDVVVPISNPKITGDAPITTRSRNPLRKLFGEERRNVPKSNSSSDGLDGLPKESYCAILPAARVEEEVAAARPKRNALATAAGNFQRRLKFIGLLNRTMSGRGNRGHSVVLMNSSNSEKKEKEKKGKETVSINRKSKSAAGEGGEKEKQQKG